VRSTNHIIAVTARPKRPLILGRSAWLAGSRGDISIIISLHFFALAQHPRASRGCCGISPAWKISKELRESSHTQNFGEADIGPTDQPNPARSMNISYAIEHPPRSSDFASATE